jgi:hypothetical protein
MKNGFTAMAWLSQIINLNSPSFAVEFPFLRSGVSGRDGKSSVGSPRKVKTILIIDTEIYRSKEKRALSTKRKISESEEIYLITITCYEWLLEDIDLIKEVNG